MGVLSLRPWRHAPTHACTDRHRCSVAHASTSGRVEHVSMHRKRPSEVSSSDMHRLGSFMKDMQRTAAQATAAASLAFIISASPAFADGAPPVDAGKVGTCLLANCQAELVGCMADPGCLYNLVCLNSCNNAPDVTACQLRCGDLYEDKAVATFNSCALSRKKCVAQRVDATTFPVPPDCALDTQFDLSGFTGRWYITAGLNPLFDIFDCQVHSFKVPEPGKLVGEINWRINKGGGDFLERSTLQEFVQQANPAVLWNHGNQYLHYEDDWYIIASKPDQYVFVYYRGNNDAWKGYGGAVVYTRAATLPEEYVPELKKAAEAAGIDWSQMKMTNNTCPPRVAGKASPNFEGVLKSFGKGFTVLESEVAKDLDAEGRALARQIQDAEQLVTTLGQEIEEEVVSEERELGKELDQLETNLDQSLLSWLDRITKSVTPGK